MGYKIPEREIKSIFKWFMDAKSQWLAHAQISGKNIVLF